MEIKAFANQKGIIVCCGTKGNFVYTEKNGLSRLEGSELIEEMPNNMQFQRCAGRTVEFYNETSEKIDKVKLPRY
jgi:hypothetical protein